MFDRKVSVQEMEMHEIEDTMTNGKYKQKEKEDKTRCQRR